MDISDQSVKTSEAKHDCKTLRRDADCSRHEAVICTRTTELLLLDQISFCDEPTSSQIGEVADARYLKRPFSYRTSSKLFSKHKSSAVRRPTAADWTKSCNMHQLKSDRQHLKTHSGEKTNKCNQCDYASFHAGHLRTHLKTHNGEKPNKCNQCNFASSRADVLREHLKTHSGEKRKAKQMQSM